MRGLLWPAAVAEALSGAHEPSSRVEGVVEDSLVREIQRRGGSMPAARALLERVVRSLGSKISWSSMAREMDVPPGRGKGRPSHHTLRDYIEVLAGGYFVFVTYFWRSGSETNELSRDKKAFSQTPFCTRSRSTTPRDGTPTRRRSLRTSSAWRCCDAVNQLTV
jgi:predicted AAA+ superfamily ATPase